MVACDVVDVNKEGDKFSLKSAKRQFLCNGSLVGSTFLPMFAVVFDQLLECFKPDGPRGIVMLLQCSGCCLLNSGVAGIPYSAYEGFHEVMTEDSDQGHKDGLIDVFIPSVPGLVAQLGKIATSSDMTCDY